jgi:hypothetical protein
MGEKDFDIDAELLAAGKELDKVRLQPPLSPYAPILTVSRMPKSTAFSPSSSSMLTPS